MKTTTILLAALLLGSASLVKAQPKLELVGGSKFDLGSVYRGAMAERYITLKNSGTDTLLISRVDVSCGCTGTMVSNDHIAPGDTGGLLITFNSKNFRGAVHKTVTVNSNDPSQPQALIQFEGTVVEDVVVTPEYLWFQDAEVGVKNTRMLTIKNDGKEGLLLRTFSSQLPGLSLALPAEPIRPGTSVQLPVVYTPAAANPVLAERMTITTSDPHQPEIVVAVYGNAKGGKADKEKNREENPQQTGSKIGH
ncbi:DUF1573 domain-containing protein [bacterium]|nr:MAG: DUF1573 domain-containing protein [bacterium]